MRAQLVKIGEKLGFETKLEYKAGIHEDRQDIIDVVWLSKNRIIIAFEIRCKRTNLHILSSVKDKKKLMRLNAREKFLINVSKTTGKTYFHRLL